MKTQKKFTFSGLLIFSFALVLILIWAFGASADNGLETYLPVILNLIDEQVIPTATPTTPAEPTATISITPTPTACVTEENLLANGSFEEGKANWDWYSDSTSEFEVDNNAYHCMKSAKISFETVGTNSQLYQTGFSLRGGANYRLSFNAFSSSGSDLAVFVQQQGAPYQNYGLNQVFDLEEDWQTFTVEFTATGISGETNDTRLRFWFPGYANAGDVYWIDNVLLQEIGAAPTSTPGSPPTETPAAATGTPVPTATPVASATPGGGGQELLVFDLNRAVTTADRGFPNDEPPINNFDWTQPVNYAAGTLYYRVEIFSQPQPQAMRLQLCFWQEKYGYSFELENCGPLADVYGGSGTVVTWSVKVADMWKKDGNPIEWYRPRFRVGLAIKNTNGDPVSDYNGWNWYGEDPSLWYPLNMHFTTVVVAPGAQFSGWNNYVKE